MKGIAKRLATALCFLICAVMLISVPLSGCVNTGRDSEVHNVHFETGDIPSDKKGTVKNMPETQEVNDGECVTEPSTEPTADGYTFQYWYTVGDGSEEEDESDDASSDTGADEVKTPYDFSTPVTSRLFLYAHWEATVTYTVTFNVGNVGASSIASQEVAEGKTATKPADPTASGYTFDGWYTDANYTTKFNFSSAITSNITLYAKWTAASNPVTYYTVTFDVGNVGAAAIASQTVESGSKATKPSDPTATGYTFDGWYTDSTYTTAFDFSSAITSDTTVYAKWTQNSTPEPDEPSTTTISVKYSTGVLNYGMATNMPEDQEVESGTVISAPAATPTMSKYEFTGWYTKAEGGREFDFTEAITQDTTIYAHWISTSSSISVGAVGDSLTAPQSWSGYNPYSYYLQQDLDAAASGVYTVSNYGVSGAAVTTLLDNTTSKSRQYIQSNNFYNVSSTLWTGGYNKSISDKPDIVIIMLGTNDAQYKSTTQNWDNQSSLTYKDNLEELITSYQENDSQVILVTSPHLFTQDAEGNTLYTFDVREEDVLKVNEVQREVADEMGLYLMDFHTYMESQTDSGLSWTRYNSTESFEVSGYTGDGLHFNTTGTSALAEYLTSAVEAVACREETGLTGNEVDVVLFAGQSNMAGRGDASNYSNVTTSVAEGHGYAYDMNTGTLGQITEPFGKDQNGSKSGYMTESSKTGSMVSSFVESYYAETEVPIVAVSASRGGSPIAAWTKGGAYCTVSDVANTYCNYYADTLERLTGAVQCVENTDGMEIRNVFIVWLQGETDGDNGTTADSYKTQLNDLYNNLSTDLQTATGYSLNHLYDIPIGTYEGSSETKKEAYNTIRQALIEFCAAHDYADVISLGMQDLTASGTSKYLRNDGYYVHLLQPGYEILGKNAGTNMGLYVDGQTVTLQRYDTDNDVWYTPTTTTITVDTAGGRITVGEWENEQTIGNLLSVPDNTDVTTTNGEELLGWYYTTDGVTYTKVTSSTYVQANMTLVPYFSAEHVNLDTNGATGNSGYVNDGGTSAGSTTSNYYQNFPATTVLNTTTYTEETLVTYTGSAALENLNWFRLNTYYGDLGVVAGENTAYNLYFTVTNYGTQDLTFTIFFCTNGWIWNTGSYAPTQSEYVQVSLTPGESKVVVIPNFSIETISSNNNFITCIVIGTHTVESQDTSSSYSITDFQLGIATGIYESTTVTLSGIIDGATISEDYLSISGGAAYDAETGVLSIDKGATIELPDEDYITAPEGYEFAGWYLDSECTNKVTSASLKDITEATTFYAKWNQKAVITLALDGVGNIDYTTEGVTTYDAYVGDSLLEIIQSKDFISLYTISGEEGKTYSITGWYIMAGESADEDSDELITSDTTIKSASITIYPKLAENDATITIETNTGITSITSSVGASTGANLVTTLTTLVNSGDIEVVFSDNEHNNAYISGWQIKGSDDNDWTDATSESTVSDTMTVRPVVSYIVITITFETDDSQILSYTEETTTITLYAEGEFTVSNSGVVYTLDDKYEITNWSVSKSTDGETWDTAVTYGADEPFDVSNGYSYKIVPNITKVKTVVTVSEAGGLISMGDSWSNSVQTIGETLVLPTASDYEIKTDRTFLGWYYTTDSSTYTKVTDSTVVLDGMTIVPYFTSDVYNLTTNNADEYTDYVHDAGSTFGSVDSNLKTSFTLGYGLCSTDYTENLIVSWTGNGSITDGYWFRLLTYYHEDQSNIELGYYNLFYELTNYGETEITITIYFTTTSQPGNSTANNAYIGAYQTVTIPAGQSVSIILANTEYKGNSSGAAPNFVTAIVIGEYSTTENIGSTTHSYSDFSLGVEIGMYASNSVTFTLADGVSLSTDYLAASGGAGLDTATNTLYVNSGATITLPTADDIELPSGYSFIGWYTDEDCTEPVSGQITVSADTTLYAKLVQEATITIELTDITGISMAEGAESTYTGSIGTNLFEILYNTDDFTSLYTLDEGYTITGWYIKVDGSDDTLITDAMELTGDITVYPAVGQATGSLTVTTIDGVTITTTGDNNTIAVVEGADLDSAIVAAIANGDITYSISDSSGTLVGWEYSTDQSNWTTVGSGIQISEGMYIRPVVEYTCTITITFDTSTVTQVEYNGNSDDTLGTLTIEVAVGTSYSTVLEALQVTTDSHYDGYTVYSGTSSSDKTDLDSNATVSGATANLYIEATPKTYTLTYASTDDYMSISKGPEDITYGNELTINFSDVADSYNNESGYDLEGFILEIDGTLDTDTEYTFSGTYTYSGTVTGNVTVYPVLTTPRSEGGYDDQGHSGMALSFQDGRISGSSINSSTVETGVFNTTRFRYETTVETTINNSTTFTDSSLGGVTLVTTLRYKITAPNTATGAFPAGTRYNEQWTVTNYNTGEIQIILYMLDHGYNIGSYDYLVKSETITLSAGASYVFTASGVKDQADTNLFLLIGIVSAPSTDFTVGVMCDYSIGTSLSITTGEGITINEDWLDGYLYDYDEETYTYTIYRDTPSEYSSNVLGSGDITLPTAKDFNGISDHATVTWTSEGETVTAIGSGASATMTVVDEYTITISFENVDEGANAAISGSTTLTLDAGTKLLDYLNDNVTITYADGYALNGWYYYNESSEKIAIGDDYYVNADITVYPNIAATTASMYVVSNGDITITTPSGDGTVAVTAGEYLESVIETYLSAKTIDWSSDKENAFIASWEYSTDNTNWYAVTADTQISDGMYIRPVAGYTATVTITFNTGAVSGVEYAGSDNTTGTLTIEDVVQGTALSDIIGDETFKVTLTTSSGTAVFYSGSDASGEKADLETGTVNADTVSIYITAEYNLSYASKTGYMSTNLDGQTITYGEYVTVSIPNESDYDNESGYELLGWYVATDGVVDTANEYASGYSYQTTVTGAITVYPVLTAPRSYDGKDVDGTAITKAVSDNTISGYGLFTGSFEASGVFNTTYFRMENILDITTNASTVSITSIDDSISGIVSTTQLGSARLKITGGSTMIVANQRYNEQWTFTNYGTETVKFNFFIIRQGYSYTSSNTLIILDSKTFELAPNESETLISSDVITVENTAMFGWMQLLDNNSSTSIKLGMMYDYTEGAAVTLSTGEGISVKSDWLNDYTTTSDGAVVVDITSTYSSYVFGTIALLPTAEDLEGITEGSLVTWYTDESCTIEVKASDLLNITGDTTFYLKVQEPATITLDISGVDRDENDSSSDTFISTTGEGATVSTYVGESLYNIVHSDEFAAMYTLGSKYSISGWYYTDNGGEQEITEETTVPGSISVYPKLTYNSSSITIVADDTGITVDQSTVYITDGEALNETLAAYIEEGLITFTGNAGAEITGWYYKSSTDSDWSESVADSSVTLEDGMSVKPYVEYFTTVTLVLTSDAELPDVSSGTWYNSVVSVTYDGETYTAVDYPTLTIKISTQSYALFAGLFSVALDDKFVAGSAVFYLSVDGSYKTLIDSSNSDTNIPGGDITVAVFAEVKTYEVSYASATVDNYMTAKENLETLTYEYGTAVTVAIPTADDYDNQSGYELQGFYIATDGSIDTSTLHAAGTTYSVASITSNITVYPLLADANTQSMTWSTDHYLVEGGSETGTHSSTTGYNSNVFRNEYKLTTNAVTNIRVKVTMAVTSGYTYTDSITFTNYNSDSLTFTVSMTKSGYYSDSSFDAYVTEGPITLEAGASYIWSFSYDCTKDDSNPMLCIYSASASYTMGLIWDITSEVTAT